MSPRLATLALLVYVVLLPGCARPDRVERVDSTMDGLFLTIETQHGEGAISNDFTRIYAHLDADGRRDKQLVLDGEYLEDTKIIWPNPHEITLCIPHGNTDTFRNYVNLRAGGVSQTVHSRLQEHCQP